MPLPHSTAEADISPTGEHLCRVCATEGSGCCRTDPSITHLCFPLSLPEWRRMLPYVSLATPSPESSALFDAEDEAAYQALLALDRQPPGIRPEFASATPNADDPIGSFERNSEEFIGSMHALFPNQKRRIEHLFGKQTQHLALRTRVDGSCVFLGTGGCRLPRKARPWYCLLFPFWVLSDSVTIFLPEDCLLAKRAKSPGEGMRLLETGPEDVRAYFTALTQDWGLV